MICTESLNDFVWTKYSQWDSVINNPSMQGVQYLCQCVLNDAVCVNVTEICSSFRILANDGRIADQNFFG